VCAIAQLITTVPIFQPIQRRKLVSVLVAVPALITGLEWMEIMTVGFAKACRNSLNLPLLSACVP